MSSMKELKKTPTIDEIKKTYKVIKELMLKLKTKEDVIKFGKEYKATMEINGNFAEDFDETETEIEWIRCEHWGCLDYIYYYVEDKRFIFDVWSDDIYNDFIDSATLETLEIEYKKGIDWIQYLLAD